MPTIKHDILSWARETSKLSIDEAAQKLQITDSQSASAADKLSAYENGTKQPSRSLLLRMSKLYRRPLLTFYLDKPPAVGDRGEDFRTLPEDIEEFENVYVDALIRDVKARQSAIRDTLIDEDEGATLEYIGSCTTEQGVNHITRAIRQTLNLDLDEYRSQTNHKESFRLLRHKAEEAGIFVLLKGNLGSYHSNIAVTAFRGFALSDDIAPFIVINDRDAESAWSFTLLHELTHLMLGQTGISGAYAEKMIEKFCNEVATEFLLPDTDFRQFQPENLDFDVLKNDISTYAYQKKVSSSHIAYRLYRRGDINKALWEKLRQYYKDKWLERRNALKEKNSQKEGGPNYYIVKHYKLGALVDLVKRMTFSGALSTTKAGMLLDVKPLKVHRLFDINQAT